MFNHKQILIIESKFIIIEVFLIGLERIVMVVLIENIFLFNLAVQDKSKIQSNLLFDTYCSLRSRLNLQTFTGN